MLKSPHLSNKQSSKLTTLSCLSFMVLALSACSVGSDDNELRHTIMVTATGGGIAGSNNILIRDGESTVIALTPYPGFVLASATGCGGSIQDGMFKTAAITDSCTVEALFLPMQTINTHITGAGSISPSQMVLAHGQGTQFELSADSGHALAEVSGCNGQLVSQQYSVSSVTDNCQISARFAPLHTVTINTHQDGGAQFSISNQQGQARNEHAFLQGERASIMLLPDPGYGLDSVSGCDGSLNGSRYTTAPLSQDCHISVQFIPLHNVSTQTDGKGSISPPSATVRHGERRNFSITANAGYLLAGVSGCNGSLNGNTYTTQALTSDCQINANFIALHHISTDTGSHGAIQPSSLNVVHGSNASFTLSPDEGYTLESVTGCNGTLTDQGYTTDVLTAPCTITASFVEAFTVTSSASDYGSITPSTLSAAQGSSHTFNINPKLGFIIDNISGCGGTRSGNSFSIAALGGNCHIQVNYALDFSASAPSLSYQANNIVRISWSDAAGASHYKVLHNEDALSGFSQIGTDVPAGTEYFDHRIALHRDTNAQYLLQSCLQDRCTDSAAVPIDVNLLVNSISYIKASNSNANDAFGGAVAISDSGNTIAVAAPTEDSASASNQSNNSLTDAGAVYVFHHDGSTWLQQAYLKASTPGQQDNFGDSLALSADGHTLVVGAPLEDSDATGIDGDQNNDNAEHAGAAYVFKRSNGLWTQTAYIKASNTQAEDYFGDELAISADGLYLAISAPGEQSPSAGVNAEQSDQGTSNLEDAGAVYVFKYQSQAWQQLAYIKAPNPSAEDQFGHRVKLSASAPLTLAISSYHEDGSNSGINAPFNDNSARTGAVWIYDEVNGSLAYSDYIKASNAGSHDWFGVDIDLSADGNTLAVGAIYEDDASTGVGSPLGGAQATQSGAVYVYQRSGIDQNWQQQAYIKASNTGQGDSFGYALSLSNDGDTLAVAAINEDSNSQGINGEQSNNDLTNSGAVYLFTRATSNWSQNTYIKAAKPGYLDNFGNRLALSGDGNSLVVGTANNDGESNGINPPDSGNLSNSGAIFIY